MIAKEMLEAPEGREELRRVGFKIAEQPSDKRSPKDRLRFRVSKLAENVSKRAKERNRAKALSREFRQNQHPFDHLSVREQRKAAQELTKRLNREKASRSRG